MKFPGRALLTLALVLGMSYAARHFHADDALIYARYVRNALQGNGLVFNTGERVNALTSPLHTCLLLLTSWLLGGRILIAQWLLGTGLLAATALLAEKYVPYAGMLIAGLIYFEIFLGMETSLFIFMLLLSVVLYGSGKWNWLPVVLCLTVLTRFEGGILLLAVAWQMYKQKRWPSAVSFVPAFAILFVYLFLNHHLYGQWLPSSGTAKLQQGMSGYWGRWPTAFFRFSRAFWYPLRSLFYVLPLVAWLAWRGARTPLGQRWNAVVVPFLVILLAFCTLANVSGYLWYYAPFVLFAFVYAAMGIPRTRWACALLAVVLIHSCLLGSYLLLNASSLYLHYRNLAYWINQNTPPGSTVAAVETGTLGWYCQRPIIDIVGLTTPHNAQLLAHHDRSSWLAEDKPDYVVVHSPAAVGEAVAADSPDYERLPGEWSHVYLMKRKPAVAAAPAQ